MTKQQLRKIYKEKRKNISHHQKEKWDDLLLIQFQKFSFIHIQTVFSFLPIEEMNEPNTHLFTRYLSAVVPNLQIAYPVMDNEQNSMQAYVTSDETNYQFNTKKILEPVDGKIIQPDTIDLILVPLLIFDKQGYRVGYGKGFYDKYLLLCKKNAMKIGLSYFEPVNQIDDYSPFDIPLTHCITTEHIYEF
jgi:5-formyltetrahydrofolate cyclo-ligase